MKEILSEIKGKNRLYFLIDCGTFIIPYLKYYLIVKGRRNVTPFCKLLEFYLRISSECDCKCFFFIDNGILSKVKMLYPFYKFRRNYSKRRREYRLYSEFNEFSSDYAFNRSLILDFFSRIESVFYFGEADYQIGLVLNYLINEFKVQPDSIYIVSHDNDIIGLNEYGNCIKKIYKCNDSKYLFYPFNRYDLLDPEYRIFNYTEWVIKKSLLGDIVDNVPPVLLMDKKRVKMIFNRYKYEMGIPYLDFTNTLDIISSKILNSRSIIYFDKIKSEFKRNYLIFDIYNSEELFNADDALVIKLRVNDFFSKDKQLGTFLNDCLQILAIVSQSYHDIFLKYIKIKYKEVGNG